MSGYAAQVNAAVVDADDFSAARCIVDIGGGQGALLAAILEGAPLARGVLFDRDDVVAGATAVLQQYGVAERCGTMAGDFFAAVPASGDIYLLSSVLHDWDAHEAEVILSNVRAAMGGAGCLLLVEHVLPDGDETGGTRDVLLADAGFGQDVKQRPLIAGQQPPWRGDESRP